MSTKLPTKMSPSTARAWVSVRCMRSSDAVGGAEQDERGQPTKE